MSNQPLDRGLNVAVNHIASKLFPNGFDVSEEAPSTLEGLGSHMTETGRMLVYSGASDNTIFGDAETNWAFRAWHDWTHLHHNLPFTMAGETAAAKVQMQHLITLYGVEASLPWRKLIWAEVVGQAEYFEHHGEFPADQRAFDLSYLTSRNVAGPYLQAT